MSQLPINNTFVAPVTVVSNTENYWVVNNPIIGKMVGAHDVDNHTIRIGDGKTKYRDLNPITYIGSSGTVALPQMATEEDPGMVPCLATQDQVLEGSGHGVVMSDHMTAVFEKVKLMVSTNTSNIGAVGERALKPWKAPKPGWKVMNGQYVERDDAVYPVLKQYLEDNPYEVITSEQYEAFLNTPDPDGPGGVGGVHFYALYPDGRIRLPDTRGDYVNASGLNGEPLQWKVDAIRNIEGTFARGSKFISATGAFENLQDPTKPYMVTTIASETGGENYVGFKASTVVPTDTHNHPRGAAYLPVVYLGTGEEYLSENGLIFLAETRSKYLGEIFTYNGKIAPPGAFHLNGQDVSKAIYKSLFDHVTKYGLFKSREEWDAEYASNFTNVDFYAYNEGDDTFRLPTYNPADRYWPTDGILCVQAYHAVIEAGVLSGGILSEKEVLDKFGQQVTKQNNKWAINKLEVLKKDITLVVGKSPEAPNISAGIRYLTDRYLARAHDSGVQAKLILPKDWVMNEQVIVRDMNFGWITIEQEDLSVPTKILVPDNAIPIQYWVNDNLIRKAIFWSQNSTLPILHINGSLTYTGEDLIIGGFLESSNAVVYGGSKFSNFKTDTVFTLTKQSNLSSEKFTSPIEISNGKIGIRVSESSQVTLRNCTMFNCASTGIILNSSTINLDNVKITHCTNNCIVANSNSTAIITNSTILKNGSTPHGEDLVVTGSSHMELSNVTAGSNIVANQEPKSNGTIVIK